MKNDNEFYQGFTVAIASLIQSYDEPAQAIQIMNLNGITFDILKKANVSNFDLRIISKAWKNESH